MEKIKKLLFSLFLVFGMMAIAVNPAYADDGDDDDEPTTLRNGYKKDGQWIYCIFLGYDGNYYAFIRCLFNTWQIKNEDGEVVAEGSFNVNCLPAISGVTAPGNVKTSPSIGRSTIGGVNSMSGNAEMMNKAFEFGNSMDSDW